MIYEKEHHTLLGGIHILRRQPRGEGRGVRKMRILLNKISTKGGRGVKKVQNLVYVEYGCRLMFKK